MRALALVVDPAGPGAAERLDGEIVAFLHDGRLAAVLDQRDRLAPVDPVREYVVSAQVLDRLDCASSTSETGTSAWEGTDWG